MQNRRREKRGRRWGRCGSTVQRDRGPALRIGIRLVLLPMLVQAACAKLVIMDVGVAPQAIVRAAVGTHCLVLIDDVEKNARVQGPQRHRGVRADCGKIVRGKFDDACRLCGSYPLTSAAFGKEVVPVKLKIQHAENPSQNPGLKTLAYVVDSFMMSFP